MFQGIWIGSRCVRYGFDIWQDGRHLREEDLNSGANTENAKDDEELPCDVGEAWGYE